jgi:hypothetical protein
VGFAQPGQHQANALNIPTSPAGTTDAVENHVKPVQSSQSRNTPIDDPEEESNSGLIFIIAGSSNSSFNAHLIKES